MSDYYVNKNAQSNGDHEVHKSGCSYLPNKENRIFLGNFSECYSALVRARQRYSQVDGCYYCSNACHSS